MKKYYIWIILILWGFQIAVYAASPTHTLIMLLATIPTMKANFSQKITDKTGQVLQHSKGRMALQRPGKFRWQEISPTQQLIIANGEHLWIYDPDLEQVTIRSLTKEIGQTPALLLSNPNQSLETNFNVQSISARSDSTQWFILTPKNPDGMFTAIKLGFGLFNIQSMILEDHLGHITTIKFSKVVAGVPMADTLFNFEPPSKIDIIDETQK